MHESCLNLRERPPSREITPVPDSLGDDTNVSNNNDTASEASSSESPPLIADGDYDSLICRSCVLNNSTLRRWAGTKGAMLVIKDQEGSPWTILNGSPEEDEAEVDIQSSTISVEGPSSSAIGAEVPTKYVGATGSKRSHDSVTPRTSSEEDRTKRPRTVESQLKMRSGSETKSYIPCLAPRQPEKAKLIIDMLSSDPMELSWGAGDVFLTEGWRSRWCRCNQVEYKVVFSVTNHTHQFVFSITSVFRLWREFPTFLRRKKRTNLPKTRSLVRSTLSLYNMLTLIVLYPGFSCFMSFYKTFLYMNYIRFLTRRTRDACFAKPSP